MNYLVTGGTGYLGTFLLEELNRRGEGEILSVVRRPHPRREQFSSVIEVGLSQLPQIMSAHAGPFAVIHCAALADPKMAEENPALAHQGNVGFLLDVIAATAGRCAHLTYVSTDLVFDGMKAPPEGFTEEVVPEPHSVYGKTKLAGEQVALAVEGPSAALRLSLVYGPPCEARPSFLQWLQRRGEAGEEIPLFEDEYRTPIHVSEVVRALIDTAARQLQGVFHCGGPRRMNRVEFAEAVVPQFHTLFKATSLASVPSVPQRAEDVCMNSSKLVRVLGWTPSPPEYFTS